MDEIVNVLNRIKNDFKEERKRIRLELKELSETIANKRISDDYKINEIMNDFEKLNINKGKELEIDYVITYIESIINIFEGNDDEVLEFMNGVNDDEKI